MEKRLDSFSPEVVAEFKKVALEFVPDGGCLDDNWSYYRALLAVEFSGRYPQIFDVDTDDELIDEIIGLC